MTHKLTQLADVPGAVRESVTYEVIPCGTGVVHKFYDAEGNVVRQDYVAMVTEGFVMVGKVGEPS